MSLKRIISVICFTMIASVMMAQMGIGATAPDTSSVLDLTSTNKGFLPPRMNTIQREGIENPPEGLLIYNTDSLCLETFDGTFWHNICSKTAYLPPQSVTGGCATGKKWMDRNLGASQVATAFNDHLAYGSMFQWGRAADGHEIIYWTSSGGSDTTEQSRESSIQATTAVPDEGNAWDGKYITFTSSPHNWLVSQDDNLWQGVSGINNPCPPSYRLPTSEEWLCEKNAFSSNNVTGAYASPLKIPACGYRYTGAGNLTLVGNYARYWTSTVYGPLANALGLHGGDAGVNVYNRAFGSAVRCIKD